MKKDFLQDLSSRLLQALPSGAKNMKDDVEKNFHAILQGAFTKLELVTREEFDSQTKVLMRTRQKLEALEKEVQLLEEQIKKSK